MRGCARLPIGTFLSTVAFLCSIYCGFAAAGPLVWINDGGNNILTVDTGTGAVTTVANVAGTFPNGILQDIALSASGQLYGITGNSMLYQINSSTGAATLVGTTGIPTANALTFGPDGTLYAASSSNFVLYTVNTTTGAATGLPGSMGTASGGDLAFNNGQLYLTGSNDQLVQVALGSAVSGRNLGMLGANIVGTLPGGVLPGFGATGLATDSSGRLLATAGNTIYQVNTSNGAFTPLTSFTGPGPGVEVAFGATGALQSPSLFQTQTFTPNVPPAPTSTVPLASLPSPSHPLLDIFNSLGTNDPQVAAGIADNVHRQFILDQIEALEQPTPCGLFTCQAWSPVTKNAISVVANALTFGGVALSTLNAPVAATYDLASNVAASAGLFTWLLQPPDNQQLIWANRAVTLLDNATVTGTTGTVLGGQVTVAGGAAGLFGVGALLGADLVLWTDIIPNELRGLSQADPPASQYTTPISISLRVMPSLTGTGMPSLDRFLTDFTNASLQTSFYLNALLATIDRFSAAYQAGDAQSALLQLETMLVYLNLLKDALANSQALFDELPGMLQLAGLANTVPDPLAYTNLQDYLNTSGMPVNLVQMLLSEGQSMSDISLLYSSLASIDTALLPVGSDLYDAAVQASMLFDQTLGPIEGTAISSVPEPRTLSLLIAGICAAGLLPVLARRPRTDRITRPPTSPATAVVVVRSLPRSDRRAPCHLRPAAPIPSPRRRRSHALVAHCPRRFLCC